MFFEFLNSLNYYLDFFMTDSFAANLEKIFYDPRAFPIVLLSTDQREMTENDLLFSDLYLEEVRSSNIKFQLKKKKFENTLDSIFKERNPLLKVRAVLLVFAFTNVISPVAVGDILAYIITAGYLHETVEYEGGYDFLTKKNAYFNDTFFHELSMHRILMLNAVDAIYSFFTKYTAQYEKVCAIANKIIQVNEDSLTPINSDKLNFMNDNNIAKYKNKLMKEFPIIVPFHVKHKDYVKEKPPVIVVKFVVDRNNILKSIWKLNSFKNVNIKFEIKFINEEGIDCGGLSKEFIDCVFKEICKPETDLFDYRNNYYWFKYHKKPTDRKTLLAEEVRLKKYYCIGIFFGIVILNKQTIPIHFPPYFYKKLLHRDIHSTDLSIFDPELFESILKLYKLKITKKSECSFTYNDSLNQYRIDLTDFSDFTDNLDYDPPYLLDSNKSSYMQKTAEWIFDKSIKKEFEEFEKGFLKVKNSPMLYSSFRLDEIDRIVSGPFERNWADLKRNVSYNGYQSNSKVVKYFWKYFDNLSEEQKVNVLKFITGTTSTPPGGLKDVKMKIEKVVGQGLPRARTCFSKLYLPQYKSYEQLECQCSIAFSYSEAFGLS